ncbi:MAG: hypothetical protein HW421_2103 [Ignavibacteria bacterium]|nr:hypothetical protein [Ignavibacteria bacterium]
MIDKIYNAGFFFLLGYLFGSIPFAYLMSRIATGIDIRKVGTGNAGALNSYESTNKKWIGFAVLILDAGKGFIVFLLAKHFSYNDFHFVAMSFFASIIGHNYSIFLKFRGGRGLATTLGGILPINPLYAILWISMWFAGYYGIRKDVHIANLTGIIGAPLLLLFAPAGVFYYFQIFYISTFNDYRIFYVILSLILLLSHIRPLMKLMSKRLPKN